MTTPFWRATLTLLAGGALAQAVPLLLGPFLARLYSPEAFGQFGVVWTLATNLAVVACARYEFALPLEPQAPRARVLMALCVRVWLVVGVASVVVAWVLVQWRGHSVGWWLPLAVLAASASQALTMWATRAQAFSALSVARLLQYGGAALLQLALAGLLGSAHGLLAGAVLGAAAAAWWMAQRSPAPCARFAASTSPSAPAGLARLSAWWGLWRVPVAELKSMANHHRDFPRYNLPHAFVSALQDSLALLLLAAWASDAAAGYWALALRYLKAPASLVGGAVSQVLYPRMVGAAPQAARRLLRQTLMVLGSVALVLAVVLLALGPALFEWLFGPSWREAGALAQALAPYIAFHFVASPLAVVTLVWQAQAWALRLALWGALAFVGALALGLWWGGLMGAAWAVSGVMSGYFAFYVAALWRWPLRAQADGQPIPLAAEPQASQNPGP